MIWEIGREMGEKSETRSQNSVQWSRTTRMLYVEEIAKEGKSSDTTYSNDKPEPNWKNQQKSEMDESRETDSDTNLSISSLNIHESEENVKKENPGSSTAFDGGKHNNDSRLSKALDTARCNMAASMSMTENISQGIGLYSVAGDGKHDARFSKARSNMAATMSKSGDFSQGLHNFDNTTSKSNIMMSRDQESTQADEFSQGIQEGINMSKSETMLSKTSESTRANFAAPTNRNEDISQISNNSDNLNIHKRSKVHGHHRLHVNRNNKIVAFRHKSIHSPDEIKLVQSSLLYCTLKPLFYSMMVFGIFFFRARTSNFIGQSRIRSCTGLQVYCTGMCVFLVVNLLRTFSVFNSDEQFGYLLFFKIMVFIFWYECASRAILANYICWKKKGLPELFLTLDRICYSDGIIPYERYLRRKTIIITICCSLYVLSNTGLTAYGLFGPEKVQKLFSIFLAPVPLDAPGVEVSVIYK